MPTVSLEMGLTENSKMRLRDLQGRFRKIDDIARAEAHAQVRALATDAARAIRTEFAPHDRTGATLRTLRVTDRGGQAEITMGGGAPYVEAGTRAHPILPTRPGGRLRFETAGGIVFARRVQHPGTEADPFMERAMGRV